jgi:pimeloyl-ACP methyl ester carboxylesterase
MSPLFFTERGSGPTVLMLHGFPMHQEVWNNFAEKLSGSFHVITVDLPGFGKSALLPQGFTIQQVAETLIDWMHGHKIKSACLIGHSLGGYVALEMVKKDPSLFSSLVLFHSTAYADSAEKKQSRNKVLDFISSNGVRAFTSNFISSLFVDQDHPAIAKVKEISIEASSEAVEGYTKAMRDRPENTSTLKDFHKPILFLSSEKDGGISLKSIFSQSTLNSQTEVHILPNVAHMGMFENEVLSLQIIKNFVDKSQLPTLL